MTRDWRALTPFPSDGSIYLLNLSSHKTDSLSTSSIFLKCFQASFRVGSCWVLIANTFISPHQQSVLQSTTFKLVWVLFLINFHLWDCPTFYSFSFSSFAKLLRHQKVFTTTSMENDNFSYNLQITKERDLKAGIWGVGA